MISAPTKSSLAIMKGMLALKGSGDVRFADRPAVLLDQPAPRRQDVDWQRRREELSVLPDDQLRAEHLQVFFWQMHSEILGCRPARDPQQQQTLHLIQNSLKSGKWTAALWKKAINRALEDWPTLSQSLGDWYEAPSLTAIWLLRKAIRSDVDNSRPLGGLSLREGAARAINAPVFCPADE